MEHISLTCKHHPELRWSIKEIAWTQREDGSGYYNGCRNIFFFGRYAPEREGFPFEPFYADGTYARECDCPGSDLVLAPESVAYVTAPRPEPAPYCERPVKRLNLGSSVDRHYISQLIGTIQARAQL